MTINDINILFNDKNGSSLNAQKKIYELYNEICLLTASLISAITFAGSGFLTTAVPDTIMLAPALAQESIVLGPTPPSTFKHFKVYLEFLEFLELQSFKVISWLFIWSVVV